MKPTTGAGVPSATPVRSPDEYALTVPGPRLLLCLALAPVSENLRHQLDDAGWSLMVVFDIFSATRALRSERYGVGLLFIDEWASDDCETLRSLLHSHYDCEWVGVFSGTAKQVAGCADLVLGYLFDHHTLPVDQAHLMRTLGHAHGH